MERVRKSHHITDRRQNQRLTRLECRVAKCVREVVTFIKHACSTNGMVCTLFGPLRRLLIDSLTVGLKLYFSLLAVKFENFIDECV